MRFFSFPESWGRRHFQGLQLRLGLSPLRIESHDYAICSNRHQFWREQDKENEGTHLTLKIIKALSSFVEFQSVKDDTWPFFTQISGRNLLPEPCGGEVHPETPSPSSVLCLLLYRTEHFSRGRKGRKGAKQRRGRGVANKEGTKEKRTREENKSYPFWTSPVSRLKRWVSKWYLFQACTVAGVRTVDSAV